MPVSELPVNAPSEQTSPSRPAVVDYVEGFFDYFIDLVCICSQSSVASAFVAFTAECGFSLANAHAVMRLIHNLENQNDPQGCIEVEDLYRNTLIVWGVFVVSNLAEIRKATQIMTNFKQKKLCSFSPQMITQHNRLRKLLNTQLGKGLNYMFVALGTLTRMGGTAASIMVGAQAAVGSTLARPQTCVDPPGWTIGLGSMCAAVIGVYKVMWLSGCTKRVALLNGFALAYSVLRNASILTDHITQLIIDTIQARTADESVADNIQDDLLWLMGILITAGIFMVSQKGLNNHAIAEKKLELGAEEQEGLLGSATFALGINKHDPHTVMAQQPQWRRLLNKVGAITGAVGTSALVASAATFLADERKIEKYSMSPEYNASIYWPVVIFLGIFVFIYYTQRFLLGLSFDKG